MNFDSPEIRITGFARLSKVLEVFGFPRLTMAEKILRFKSFTPDQFLSLVSRLNGILLGLPRYNHFDNNGLAESIDKPVSIVQRGEKNKISYVAPINRLELFKKLFLQIQGEISEANVASCVFKLRLGIIFVHLFENGNGRTSRLFSKLFLGDVVSYSDVESDLTSTEESIPEKIHKIALIKLFQEEEGVQIDSIDKVLEYSKLLYMDPENMDLSRAVKGLAIRKTFPKEPLSKLMTEKPIEWIRKDRDGSHEKYAIELTRLQEKLFWLAVSVPEELQK